ncbi:MAG: cryptochrome/photolyase family protein [Candidatus Methylacidiphilales bacterium]
MNAYWILGDQLLPHHPALEAAASEDIFLFIESAERASHLRYHRHKLILLYSAMRHRAQEWKDHGRRVEYISLGQHPNGYADALLSFVHEHRPETIYVMEPNEWEMRSILPKLSRKIGLPIQTLPTRQFLVERESFAAWADGKKHLLMEHHYRRERRRLGLLLDREGQPEGGAWNFDADNRQGIREFQKTRPAIPPLTPEPQDTITRAVMREVAQHFPDHPGKPETFWLPVTRDRARIWLERFIEFRLAHFGPFEDLMVQAQPFLFHSVLSPLLNIGLLTPVECVEAAEKAFREGRAPLASVEGFIRQIVGWREFINGVYWLHMPGYRDLNALGGERPLPRWAYNGETDLNCVAQTLRQAIDLGYNHHIQRLMVLGNYFLLGAYHPASVVRWFLEMYVDAYDWVMQPNVLGMVLHADGGLFATKPYAAGPAYLSRMSDYCKGCRFKPTVKSGPDACPFHALYWNFFDRNQQTFQRNPRIGMMLKTLERMTPSERSRIRRDATAFLDAQNG